MSKRCFGNAVPQKTIRSHAGLARFMAALDARAEPVAYVARVEGVPSPYSYSPTWPVYSLGGKLLFVRETSHRVFDVFPVLPGQPLLDEDDRPLARG